MMLTTIDLAIIAIYATVIVIVAQLVSRERQGHKKNAADYFLAGRTLPWWAIGASLIAANISAEQIIGMSGSGFAIGLAIASYEWMAAITLIIVGKYFLPVFLHYEIYTMPQFLERRFDHNVRFVLAIFWLGVYVFVNLTSILWLGATAINAITGLNINGGLIILAALAALYSLYGGLKAIAFTDIIQVVVLVCGGLLIAYIMLVEIGGGVIDGFRVLTELAPEKFDMILSPDSPHYVSLPGLSVLVGGMWVMNLSYWGFNQYIIQRGLAARNLKEAQKGIVMAAYLKLLMPVIVVLPGIAAVVLAPNLETPDLAYPEMVKLVPEGVKGLVFAALVAAIISSLASMVNSIATLFTMDIYRHFRPGRTDEGLVVIGRVTGMFALVLAVICARPLLGDFDQAFQYIQEFTGFFTPGIVVIFVLGIFWKGTTVSGALTAAIGSVLMSLTGKILWPELPFIDRVGIVFLLCMVLAIVASLRSGQRTSPNAINTREISFATSRFFNLAAGGVILILSALYVTWW